MDLQLFFGDHSKAAYRQNLMISHYTKQENNLQQNCIHFLYEQTANIDGWLMIDGNRGIVSDLGFLICTVICFDPLYKKTSKKLFWIFWWNLYNIFSNKWIFGTLHFDTIGTGSQRGNTQHSVIRKQHLFLQYFLVNQSNLISMLVKL